MSSAAETAKAAKTSTAAKTILVIDDDPRYLDVLRQRLQAVGYRVLLAFDGETGLARARELPPPDAVLTDVLLPRLDGFALCHALKSDPATAAIPVILMSAIYMTEADRERGLRTGAQDYLIKPDVFLDKPIRYDDLLAHLQFLLGDTSEPPSDEHTEGLLLVEDDERSRRMLKMTLAGKGYRLHEAADGQAALEILQREPIDLVLSDIQMPGMSGLELLARIRASHPELMVVMMTAFGSEKIAVEAMKRGANDYLTKPIKPSELAAVLRENLEKHRLLIEHQRLLEKLKETSRDLMARVEKLEAQNAQLEASRNEIERASRAQIELVSTISHELRTPLTVIKGALKMVIEAHDRLPETQRADLLRRSLGQTERVISLTNTFLDLERLESGRVVISPRPIDLLEVARETCEALQPAAADAAMRLEFKSEVAAAPILADREAVQRMLDNLIANALKYAAPTDPASVTRDQGPDVDVILREDGDAFLLEVRDRGPGVPDILKERIFERFFREGAATPGKPSTGLGLAIVRSLVQLHDGQVSIDDRDGGGAIFRIRLPKLHPVAPSTAWLDGEILAIGLGEDLAEPLAGMLAERQRRWRPLTVDQALAMDPTTIGFILLDLAAPEAEQRLFELLKNLERQGAAPTWILPAEAPVDPEAERLFPFVEVFPHRPSIEILRDRLRRATEPPSKGDPSDAP